MRTITNFDPPASPARIDRAARTPLRVGLVQHAWQQDTEALQDHLIEAIGTAAGYGASVVFLPELTLSRYPAFVRAGYGAHLGAEELRSGPTYGFARRAAKEHGVLVHASLFERADTGDGLGFNTAILVDSDGKLLGSTRKLHIPASAAYHEDTYFRPGPAGNPYPVYRPEALHGAAIGMPTCWDEWFPEVSRCYSLAGAELLVYPTAIGSEPDFPGFDTQPLWQQVIIAGGITAATFMVVPNRTGDEGALTFYGSSFISDPYGRVLVTAPR
ncbi:MAG: nitrilase-related carbon-nitrogen hydrolase, partial [Sciscionella sp.]